MIRNPGTEYIPSRKLSRHWKIQSTETVTPCGSIASTRGCASIKLMVPAGRCEDAKIIALREQRIEGPERVRPRIVAARDVRLNAESRFQRNVRKPVTGFRSHCPGAYVCGTKVPNAKRFIVEIPAGFLSAMGRERRAPIRATRSIGVHVGSDECTLLSCLIEEQLHLNEVFRADASTGTVSVRAFPVPSPRGTPAGISTMKRLAIRNLRFRKHKRLDSGFGNRLPVSERSAETAIQLKADISSGDDPRTNTLRTFNPLFPKGNYFGVLATAGPGPINFIDAHPRVEAMLPQV